MHDSFRRLSVLGRGHLAPPWDPALQLGRHRRCPGDRPVVATPNVRVQVSRDALREIGGLWDGHLCLSLG